MKRTASLFLAILLLLALAGCKTDNTPKGPTEVDYGSVGYLTFSDENALSFSYLDCFVTSEMYEKGDPFVAYSKDGLGVLTYEYYDPFGNIDYDPSKSYTSPSRNYSEILSFTDDDAMIYLKAALGMVASQGASFKVDDFKFERNEGYVLLLLEGTAEYSATGEIQKLFVAKYVVENERVYSVQVFAPASVYNKYGPLVKDFAFDLQNALTVLD